MPGVQAFDGASRGRSDFELYARDIYVERRKGEALYDPRCELPVSMEIVHSLSTLPQTKDLVVWKDDAGRWVLIDGHQTHAAGLYIENEAKKARLPLPKLRVTTLKVESIAEVLRFKAIANLRIASPKSITARAVLKLRAQGVEDAEIVRCHPEVEVVAAVETYVKLAEMSPAVHAAVDAGTIAITTAVRQLAKLPRAEQSKAIAEIVSGVRRPASAELKSGRPSVTALRKIVARVGGEKGTDQPEQLCERGFYHGIRFALGLAPPSEIVEELPGFAKYLTKSSIE